jgi:hypothetical protein
MFWVTGSGVFDGGFRYLVWSNMKTANAPMFDNLYGWTGNNVVVTAEA